MTNGVTLVDDVEVRCGKCGQGIETKMPMIVNCETDAELTKNIVQGKYLSLECYHCGFDALVSMPFIFHDPKTDFLAVVVHQSIYETFNDYLKKRAWGKRLLEKYFEILAVNNHYSYKLQEVNLKVIPYEVFCKKINMEPMRIRGYFHFSPLPKIDLFEDSSEETIVKDDFHLKIIDNNYSDRLKILVDYIKREFDFSESYLPTHNDKYVGPIGTYGITDILFNVSHTILLPIVLGVVANQLHKIFFDRPNEKLSGKDKAKIDFEKDKIKILSEQFSLSDELSIIIHIEAVKKNIKLSGTLDEIINEAITAQMFMLLSMYIPGNCHTSVFVNDYFADAIVDDKIYHVSEFPTFYKKHFASDTRAYIIDAEATSNQREVSEIAKQLIKEKKYNEALNILLSIDTDNIPMLTEYAYNMGICYRELGEYGKACSYFQFILHNAILAPSIESINEIITSSSSIDEEDKKRLTEGIKTVRNMDDEFFDKFTTITKEKNPKLYDEAKKIMSDLNLSSYEKTEKLNAIIDLFPN